MTDTTTPADRKPRARMTDTHRALSIVTKGLLLVPAAMRGPLLHLASLEAANLQPCGCGGGVTGSPAPEPEQSSLL